MPDLNAGAHRVAKLDQVVREGYARLMLQVCSKRFTFATVICRRSIRRAQICACIAMANTLRRRARVVLDILFHR